MNEVTYFPEVECEVFPGGFIPNAASAALKDLSGRTQFVQVTTGLINNYEGKNYLPVGLVEIDRHQRRVLIELPVEADSGANRMWVSFDSLRKVVLRSGVAV